MRIGLSLLGLLIVVFLVARLSAFALHGGAGTGAAPGSPDSPASAAAATANQVEQAMQRAAALRASEAAAQ